MTVARVSRWIAPVAGLSVWLIVALFANWLAPFDPFLVVGEGLRGPSFRHPLGTDLIGRDLLSGVIHGARTSATIVIGVALIVIAVSFLIGLISGFLGGEIGRSHV